MRSKRIQLKLSAELLDAIDAAATAELNSRSGFIRESVVMRLKDRHLSPNPRVEDVLRLLSEADG